MATRSHRRSASSRKCVVSTTHRPPSAAARISRHASLRDFGSRPLVGSSSNTTRLGPTSAIAICSLRFIPPLSVSARARALFSRPTSRNFSRHASSTSSAGTPLSVAYTRRCSSHVNDGKSTFICGHTPRTRRASASAPRSEWPATSASPSVGGVRPVNIATVVDFPAPLGPRRPVTCPSYSARLSERTARVGALAPFHHAPHPPSGLYVLETPRITTAARRPSAGSIAAPFAAAASSTAAASVDIDDEPIAFAFASSNSSTNIARPLLAHPSARRARAPRASRAPAHRQYAASNGNHHGRGVPCADGRTFPRYHAATAYRTPPTHANPTISPRENGSS